MGHTHETSEDIRNSANLDPDYFDIVVQCLSILSSIATLGASWLAINQSQERRDTTNLLHQIEDSIRRLERDFDDTFYNARRVLKLLRQYYEEREGKSIDYQVPRFGTAAVHLSHSELQEVMQPLANMNNATNMMRSDVMALQNSIAIYKPPGEDSINFDLAQFNDDINDVLFGSNTLGEATTKLSNVQAKAEDFIRSARHALQSN